MANRCMANGAHLGQTKLPPIRRKYGLQPKPMLRDFGDEKFPSRLPRPPQIEGRPLLQPKISQAFREREGNRESLSTYLTISEKNPSYLGRDGGLETHFEQINKVEKMKTKEIINLNCKVGKKNSTHHEGELPNRCMVHINYVAEKDYSPKKAMNIAENAFRRPVQLLRRSLKPEKVYQPGNGQMSHEELLAFDQNMDQLHAFTERDIKIDVNDFHGKKINLNDSENGDITSYMTIFETEHRANRRLYESRRAATKINPKNKLPTKKETKARVEARFLEALDLHFYHYYRNTHPARRMAICEEIERTIFIENVSLSWYRDNLRLQDVLDSWML